jgi:hypothetical protein
METAGCIVARTVTEENPHITREIAKIDIAATKLFFVVLFIVSFTLCVVYHDRAFLSFSNCVRILRSSSK